MKTSLFPALILCAALWALERGDLSTFSDGEEAKTSLTTIQVDLAGEVVTARFRVPDHPAIGYAYAGIQVALGSAEGMRSLGFQWRRSAEAPAPKQLTLRTRDGKRLKLDLAPYGAPGPAWTAVGISFDDFGLSPFDASNLSSASFTLASHTVKDAIPLQEGTVEFRRLAWSAAPVPGRVSRPEFASLLGKKKALPPGHSAWIYDPSEAHVARLRAYNQSHPVPIRHLFVYAGSISWGADGKAALSALKGERLAWFQGRLPGMQIWANIDALDAKKLGAQPWAEQERLAREIAAAVDGLEAAAGAHFDVEPYDGAQFPFYAAMKRLSSKPVSAAFGSWDFPVLQVVDLPVLMAYDLAKAPKAYGEAFARLARPFIADCAAAGTTGLLGLPFAAAMMEYEYREHRTSGAREKAPYVMEDFLSAALAVFDGDPGMRRSPGYAGVSVWALPTEGKKGIGPPRSEWGYYPNTLKEGCLDLLERFSR